MPRPKKISPTPTRFTGRRPYIRMRDGATAYVEQVRETLVLYRRGTGTELLQLKKSLFLQHYRLSPEA